MNGLREQVDALHWYHTMELTNDVVTPGWFDTRASVSRVPLPASLEGLRCLDVGTWDGFWAFELERRGAASVTAIDIDDPDGWDWPPQARAGERHASGRAMLGAFKSHGAAFDLARTALGSEVQRVDLSVYELDPAVHGSYDLVFVGSLLLHLRDPIAALERLRSVCAGEIVIADMVEVIPSLLRPHTPTVRLEGLDRPWWWMPNVAALRRMVQSAGFEIVESAGVYYIPLGPAHPRARPRDWWGFARSAAGREQLINLVRGVPHSALRATP